jgi:hypothetical protein
MKKIDIDDLYHIEKPNEDKIDMSFVMKEKLANNQDPRIYDYEYEPHFFIFFDFFKPRKVNSDIHASYH